MLMKILANQRPKFYVTSSMTLFNCAAYTPEIKLPNNSLTLWYLCNPPHPPACCKLMTLSLCKGV